MAKGIKALEIPLDTVRDLARLVAVIRGSSSFLLAFPRSGGLYVLGTYLHPVADNVSTTFPFVDIGDRPQTILGFASDVSGREVLSSKDFSSPGFLSIPVAFATAKPHVSVPPGDIKCSTTRVSVEDLSSLTRLAVSTVSEDFLPFVWYDLSRKLYVLSVKTEGSDETEGGLMIFDCDGPQPGEHGNYIRYRLKGSVEELELTEGVNDYSAKFVAVIKTSRLPYLEFPEVRATE